jgi:hypothetical protein
VPNAYDYLDDTSILRAITDYLIEISKLEDDQQLFLKSKFELLAKILCESCFKSVAHLLPPINWYYFASMLLKSKHGKCVETELIKITIYLIAESNSAFSLVKNFLIDTNYFHHLNVSRKEKLRQIENP